MACIAKPTADDVRQVIQTNLTDAAIDSIIRDAALVAESCIESLDADRQTAILRWLAAHLITAANSKGGGALASDRIGDAARSWHTGALGVELKSTSYGMAALQLDPNGCLARIGKARASIEKV